MNTPASASSKSSFAKWAPLIVLSFALLIIVLDTTILNVSLRTIINDLHTNIQSIQWVITAYSLMLAAFTITGGRLGDLFGRKRMFIVGAIIFAVGSFITSISQSVGVMVLGEAIIEGIGAALMLPATASLLVSEYVGRDRQVAFGVWGGIAAAGAAIGPVFGGFLTTYYSWRWAFRVNLFVAAILVITGIIFIDECRDEEEKPKLDFVGVLLSAAGLLLVVFGFIESSTYGWIHSKVAFMIGSLVLVPVGGLSIVIPSIILGLGVLALFALWQAHREKEGKTPLVSLALFKNAVFIRGASITAILALGQTGISFILPIFLQGVLGYNAVSTGVALLPMSIMLLIVSFSTVYLSKFITPKRLIQAGLILDAISFVAIRAGIHVTSSLWSIAPGLLLFGAGTGLMMSQASNLTLSAVSVDQSGEASGVNTTFRQVGSSLGSAILGAILLSALVTNLVGGVQASTVIPSEVKPQVIGLVQTQSSNIEFGTGISIASATGIPADVGEEVTSIANTATVDAARSTLLYGLIFVALAFILTIRLPNKKFDHKPEQAPAAGH